VDRLFGPPQIGSSEFVACHILVRMRTAQLTVDPELFNKLTAMAEERRCTVGELIAALIRERGSAPPPVPPFVGLFADEPELMDQIMADVYRTRESPLRSEPANG
jgi:hypothetical protein